MSSLTEVPEHLLYLGRSVLLYSDLTHRIYSLDLDQNESIKQKENSSISSSSRSTFIDNKESFKQISRVEHFSHA